MSDQKLKPMPFHWPSFSPKAYVQSGGCSQSDLNSSLLEELTQLFQVSNLTCASHLDSQGTVLQKEGRVFIQIWWSSSRQPSVGSGESTYRNLAQKETYCKVRTTSYFSDWRRISASAIQPQFDLGRFHMSNILCYVLILEFSWGLCRSIVAGILAYCPPVWYFFMEYN